MVRSLNLLVAVQLIYLEGLSSFHHQVVEERHGHLVEYKINPNKNLYENHPKQNPQDHHIHSHIRVLPLVPVVHHPQALDNQPNVGDVEVVVEAFLLHPQIQIYKLCYVRFMIDINIRRPA